MVIALDRSRVRLVGLGLAIIGGFAGGVICGGVPRICSLVNSGTVQRFFVCIEDLWGEVFGCMREVFALLEVCLCRVCDVDSC